MSDGNGKVRVLQVHNHYAPGWGGEDTVVALERRLLQERGHMVDEFRGSNEPMKNAHVLRQLLAVPGFLWSQRSYRALRQRIAEFRPDVVHVHNTFPELSPSVFWAARRSAVPVVQTLHNFRHLCANALLLRDGTRCEQCVEHRYWPALLHRCYADSRMRTAAVVAVNVLHWALGTYGRVVDAYITLNDFNREVFRRAGLPGQRLLLKPNFVPVSLLGNGGRKRQVIFVGRIDHTKGVRLLLEAWEIATLEGAQVLLIGDGPERDQLARQFAHLPGIAWAGRLERAEVLEHMAASRVLVFPSLASENCPMVVLEALSVATPVVIADHASLSAIVQHDRSGLVFHSGDPQALASALRQALQSDEQTWTRWSNACRQIHAERYSDAVNYQQLISIYQSVIQGRAARALEA